MKGRSISIFDGKILNSERSEFFNAMFTGIITNLGKISGKGEDRLSIEANKTLLGKLSPGLSISIDGMCLTVISKSSMDFSVNFMPETENKTNLKYLKAGGLVNLELPATPTSFLSGHILQGHIDTIARLADIRKEGNSKILKFTIPPVFSKYIVSKGSIAVNGISLTIIKAGRNFFTCGIIPHTWKNTKLQSIKSGDFVNIEVDILGKYLEKLVKI